MQERPLLQYDPNPVLAALYRRFFERIEVDDAWLRDVRGAMARGTVVYVLRNLSLVDFLALDYLTKRHDLPRIRFANDLGFRVFEPIRMRGWQNALRPPSPEDEATNLVHAVSSGASAALFLKRPPHLFEGSARGQIEGDHLISALLRLERGGTARVLLVPQVFVWSRTAGTRGGNLASAVFGPSEWPGNLRSVAQFLGNRGHATLRAGEAIALGDFLEREGAGASDDVLVRRLNYALLRRLERERSAILGPTRKPADRVAEAVIRSPKLQKVIADLAGEGAKERAVINARAQAMVRELQANLDMNALAALDQVVSYGASRMFSAIEVDEEGIERVRQLAKDGTIVFLPSHKSHMDYVALAWILYRHRLPMPLIAAGDNLNFFPLGPIFRRAGAFYIRRTFGGDRLYAAVVDAYVRRMLKEGAALEFFLEGGRSRSGKPLSPKLGLLSLVVDAAIAVPTRTTWFCPVSIGYERFVEEKAFVREIGGGEKQKETIRGLLKSAEVMVGHYGRLNVQFGRPLSLGQILAEIDPHASPDSLATMPPARRRALITRLGFRAMNEINAATAATPGSLVATALLAHEGRGLPYEELLTTCERLARTLRSEGARFSPSLAGAANETHALREAADLFVRAGNVKTRRVASETIYVVPDDKRTSIDLAKNAIIHFFAARALIATALLASPPGPPSAEPGGNGERPVPLDSVRERVLALSRLFKYELTFRADAPFERIFEEEIAAMEIDGEVERLAAGGVISVVPKGNDGSLQIGLYARLLHNFLEGYRVAARGLAALLRGPLANKDLTRRAIATGERMFLAGEIGLRESISRPLFDNAYGSFADQGYVARVDGGKLALTASYATARAVGTIEGRIAAMGVTARTPPPPTPGT
ncbi:MAG TPA: 1-acyl-sn-glycerol-3-phosphate acyltransferase [Polyangiaceae bacterium]|nr:1-acyl-sn-glycerol-3-phosphate acyltransferase [Polyangiaceae bacterium]